MSVENRNNVIMKKKMWLGMVAHICNPSTLGAEVVVSSEVRSLRPA